MTPQTQDSKHTPDGKRCQLPTDARDGNDEMQFVLQGRIAHMQ